MFNDGRLTIFRKVITDENRGALKDTPLEQAGSAFYGEISFTANEYYQAQQSEVALAKKVMIHQDKSVNSDNMIVIDNVTYNVGRCFNTVKKGIAITEITLEKVI